MRHFQDLSIRHKQALIILATSSVALLLACAAFVAYDIFSFRETLVSKLNSLATLIGDANEAAIQLGDAYRDDAEKSLSNLSREKHIVRAYLYRIDNGQAELFAVYRRDPADQRPPPPPAPARKEPRFGARYFVISVAVVHHGQQAKPLPVGRIDIESDLDELYERLERYVGIVAGVLAGSLLIAMAISSGLQRIISEPILHLAKVARTVSLEKNYSIRLPQHPRQDELGQLTSGFNEMLEQIQARESALKNAQSDLERRVDERTKELLQEVADRKRAEQALHQQLTRISLLNSITRAIAARQDLESVVHVILKELEDHLPVDFGSVLLFDPKTRTIKAAAHRTKDPFLIVDPDLIAEGHALDSCGLEACRSGQTLTVPDTRQMPALIWNRLASAGLLSAIAVPLTVESDLFGILLTARLTTAAFSSGEGEFLRMLSEQVALAAHQARLHAQLQRAYNELRQSQEAAMQQERLRALGQMASGIAHDINNALSPIVVYSELLLQTEPNLSGSSIKNLEMVKTAGQDIAHIVSRMREFYRRRDEKDAFGLVNLNKLANQVIDLTRPRWRNIAQASGIMVDLQMDCERALPEIMGNESELREALTNLILNAVDAMPTGGKLFVRTRLRKSSASQAAQAAPAQVTLEISDTGIGMDEQTRQRCLEPFFSTKGQRGTGLGLAMVYGIMERHEGSIEIESEVGKGTTMRLVFPIKKPVRARTPQAQEILRGLPPLRILCVDDEPVIRDALKQILEFGHHKVELADGGQAGLDRFRAAQKKDGFDVVITDLGMPYLDGRQLASKLKAESPATPVIMLTGWGTLMKGDGDVPADVDGILSKPPKMAEIYDMLRKVSQR